MTTAEPTTASALPAWLEALAPQTQREEAELLATRLACALDEHRADIERAREMLAALELQKAQATRGLGDDRHHVVELLAKVSGSQVLFDALTDIAEECDPTMHPVYAALTEPRALRIENPIIMTNPAGEEVRVWLSPAQSADDKHEAIDIGNPEVRWQVTQGEVVEGVLRGIEVFAGISDAEQDGER